VTVAKDANTLRHRSIRLPGYDYTQAGAYFITVCTRDRQCLCGDIIDGESRLSAEGQIVEECWKGISIHFPEITPDVFVVMPNHLHGVLWIEAKGAACSAPTIERFGRPVSNSVPTIVRSFKAAVTRQINLLHSRGTAPERVEGRAPTTIWQRNYYERVIRNEEELRRIRQYIVENPLRWALDRENPQAMISASFPKRPSLSWTDDIESLFESR